LNAKQIGALANDLVVEAFELAALGVPKRDLEAALARHRHASDAWLDQFKREALARRAALRK
jgi:hypothetical protein